MARRRRRGQLPGRTGAPMSFETDPEKLLSLAWSSGPMGKAFLVLAALSLADLLVLVARSRFVLSLNTEAFLRMVEKLIVVGNLDRAIKLTSAHDGPVARLTRAGLKKAAEATVSDPADQGRLAESEMRRLLPEATARVRQGMLPALLLAVAAFATGIAAGAVSARAAAPGIGAVLLAVAVLAIVLTRDVARFERDLATAIEKASRVLKVRILDKSPNG